jgi:hypothetical protein
MATQDANENDLQSLASLLADIERQLTSEKDQSELIWLRDLRQQCLRELALVWPSKRNTKG